MPDQEESQPQQAPVQDRVVLDGRWVKGLNSLFDPSLLQEGEYQWSQNTDNSGGIISPRQGFNAIGSKTSRLPALEPKGIAVFKDKNGLISIVIAIGDQLYVSYYPFTSDFQVLGDGFSTEGASVVFCRTFKGFQLQADGSITAISPPYPVLVMQNGVERAKYWDGATLSTADPSIDQPEIPIGKWMQWSGGRLWVASGNLLHASNLIDPIKFTEELNIAGGGALFFEDTITGMNQTPDLSTLLVSIDFDTSTIQSNIFDRTQWGLTPGFQRVFLPGIGCAAGKSYVRHWGVVWWYSHGGLVELDQAIQTYRTSRIRYRDQEMMKSKSNLADDISGIAMGTYGNYMLVSVPSGDKYNAHTWVVNQRVWDVGIDPYYGDPSEWASNWTGIKPVEYVTAVIDGRSRLFCLSRDDGDGSQAFYPNVWELFTGERQDRFNDHTFHPPCSLETRLLGMSADLKTFAFAVIDLAEIVGKCHLDVFVAGRRGGYHQILSKDIVASEGSINSPGTAQFVTNTSADLHPADSSLRVLSTVGSLDAPSTLNLNGVMISYTAKTDSTFTIAPSQVTATVPSGTQVIQPQFSYPNPDSEFPSFVPQRRIIRTSGWEINNTECMSAPVESRQSDNIDRGFTLLLNWTGRMSITGLKCVYRLYDEQDSGDFEPNEELAQSVDDSGCGMPSNIIETVTIDSARTQSQYLRVITPKHDDLLGYSPLPPNLEV